MRENVSESKGWSGRGGEAMARYCSLALPELTAVNAAAGCSPWSRLESAGRLCSFRTPGGPGYAVAASGSTTVAMDNEVGRGYA